MNKNIKHPKPDQRIFCIIRPVPGYKMQLYDEQPVYDFEDPETKETYKARRIDAAWYPVNLISRFISRIAAQKEPEELAREVKSKYKLSGNDKIGFYLFKLID